MLNVVGGSKNFGADNDLECEATQLGKRAAGQKFSQNNLLRIVDRQKVHLKGISLTTNLESNKLIVSIFE